MAFPSAYAPSPAAAYHAGYYAGLQAAQAALKAALNSPAAAAPLSISASPGFAPAPTTFPAAGPTATRDGSEAAPQPAGGVRAAAPYRGVYGAYGGYSAAAVEPRKGSFAHAPVVREYPLGGLPTPAAAPAPERGTAERPNKAPL